MAWSNERQVHAPSGRVCRGWGVNDSLKLAFSQNVLLPSVPIRIPLQLQGEKNEFMARRLLGPSFWLDSTSVTILLPYETPSLIPRPAILSVTQKPSQFIYM